MRFERIDARSFGAFENRTLTLASGFNLIHGPNESGKSTWHGALYFGLCGMRRSRGAARGEDRVYAERYRPWKGDTWEVGAIVALDDGRRIELRHDLDGRVDCRAIDAALGRDVSGEITYEGAPDGARLLGLDRRAFLATACIRQADLLGIIARSELLQEHLQRAAASARSDGTAAAAIARLDEFQRDQVGLNRANSTKPLRRAADRLEAARSAVQAAHVEHREYCHLIAVADELRANAAEAVDRVRALRAVQAARDAAAWNARLGRARELAARFPDGAPTSRVTDDALASEVESALRTWDDRPAIAELGGTTAADLRAQIAALPGVPDGDRTPHPDVVSARKACEESRHALRLHESDRPPTPKQPAAGGATEEMLRDLARDLELEVPVLDPTLEANVAAIEESIRLLADQPRRRVVLIVAIAAALCGASALTFEATVAGLVMLAVAGVALITWLLVRPGPQVRINALADLRIAEEALGVQKHRIADIEGRRDAATKAATARGLAADADALRTLAHEVADAALATRDLDLWTLRHRHLIAACEAADARLVHELRLRGVIVSGRIVDAAEAYVTACAERTRVAAVAARRPDLERELAAREAAERGVADAKARNDRAAATLRLLVQRCTDASAASVVDPDADVAALRDWQGARAARIADEEQHRAEWVELETLLAGSTMDDVAAKADLLAAEAASLRAQIAVALLAATASDARPEHIETLQRAADEAARAAAHAEGALATRRRDLPSVAEAEEELASATADLERLQALEQTLAATRTFLERAQERVHRDIAPVLAESVRRWIAPITGDRYTDVLIDPHSLELRVRTAAGDWRDATGLSHGTTEQVYLLLRMALAKHLTKPGESCPLILDDVTVQSDRTRTVAILDALHAISREHQVILFSQEDEVLTWAEQKLTDQRDRIERLPVVPVAA